MRMIFAALYTLPDLASTLCARRAASTRRRAKPGLTKVTLQADWYPQPEHGGFFTALVKGYYKDEGSRRHDFAAGALPGRGKAGLLRRRAVRDGIFRPHTGSDCRRTAARGRRGDDAARSARHHGPEGFSDPFVRRPERSHSGDQDRLDLVGIYREEISIEQRARSSGDDERGKFRRGPELRAAGFRHVGAVLRAKGGSRDARAADQRCRIQPRIG